MPLSITLPTSWQELSDSQLCYICRLTAAGFDTEKMKSYFVLRCVPREMLPRIRPDHLAVAVAYLDFIDTPAASPVRPSRLAGGTALPANLLGVAFADYLVIENLWQGSLYALGNLEGTPTGLAAAAGSPSIRALLEKLYPGYKAAKVQPWHIVAMLIWMQGMKAEFARTFPHLFHSSADSGEEPDMREVMETEIRALTAGDITKREQVLQADTWTALTELDAKAREAEEMTKGH